MSDVHELGPVGFIEGIAEQVGDPCPARGFAGVRCGAPIVEKAMRAREARAGVHRFVQYVRCERGHITFAE